MVNKGIAEIPCGNLCDILMEIYNKILHYGLQCARKRSDSVFEDVRIKMLGRQLQVSA